MTGINWQSLFHVGVNSKDVGVSQGALLGPCSFFTDASTNKLISFTFLTYFNRQKCQCVMPEQYNVENTETVDSRRLAKLFSALHEHHINIQNNIFGTGSS